VTADGLDLSGLVTDADLRSLLAGVRREGVQLAHSRLVTAYAEALVQAVTRQQPQRHDSPAAAETAETPTAEMPQTGCYLYAVVAGDGTGAATGDAGVEPGGAVEVVTVDDLSAVVSEVDLVAMREGGSAEQITEDGWLATAVRAHERVVLAAFHSAPTVPMRFGIVHPDRASVLRLLTEHAGDLREQLRTVAASAEWSVRVRIDTDVVARYVADGADVSDGDGDGAGVTGRAYLLRERARRDIDDRVHTYVRRRVDEVTQQLAALAQDVVVTPAPSGGACPAVFSAAYLVARGDEDRLIAIADGVSGFADAMGVTVEVTGPWPPYHFTTLRLEAHDA